MKMRVSKAVVGAVAVAGMLSAFPVTAIAETPNLTAADRRGPCRDPWINYAYRTQIKRTPVGRADAGECNIYLYAGGAWQNYDQLRDGVNSFVRGTSNVGATVQAVGALFAFVNRATGGRLDVIIRTATKGMFDINGSPRKTYRLLSTDRQVDLGGGSTLIVPQ